MPDQKKNGSKNSRRKAQRGRQRAPAVDEQRGRSQSRGRSSSRSRSQSKSAKRSNSQNPKSPTVKRAAKILKELTVPQGMAAALRDLDYVPPNDVTFDITASTQTSYQGAVSRYAALLVAKVDSIASQAWGTGGTSYSPRPTPQGAKLAILAIAFAYFKKIGLFTDYNLQSTLVDPPADTPVPVSIAKLIQYFAPYSKGGVHYRFIDTTSGLPTVGTTGQLRQTATDQSYCDVDVWPTIDTGVNERSTATATVVTSWEEVIKNAPTVMAYLKQLGIATVPFGRIPKFAPDASLYAAVDWTNYVVGCGVSDFDPNVAIMSLLSFNTYGNHCSHVRPIGSITSSMTTRGRLSNANAFDVGWIENLQACDWNNGTVKQMLRSSKYGPVKIPQAEIFDMDLRNWHLLMSAEIVKMISNGVITDAVSLYQLIVNWESAMLARLGDFGYLIQPSGNRNYNDSYKSLPVPPFMSLFLSMLGPTVVDGRLRIVVPMVQGKSFLDPSLGATWFSGTSPLYAYQNICLETAAGGTPPAWTIGSMVFNSTNFPGAAGVYPLTPILQVQNFLLGMDLWVPGNGVNRGALIPPDANRLLGGTANLAFVSYGPFNGLGSKKAITNATALSAAFFTRYNCAVSGVCSDVSHSKGDVILSILMGIILCPSDARFMHYAISNFNEPGLVTAIVEAENSQDVTETLAFLRSRYASVRVFKGQTSDNDGGNPLFGALAAIATPILANVAPTIFRWAKEKVLDKVSNSGLMNTSFSVMGKQIGVKDALGFVADNMKVGRGQVGLGILKKLTSGDGIDVNREMNQRREQMNQVLRDYRDRKVLEFRGHAESAMDDVATHLQRY